eukprot:15856-Heterococcus_DN1.PRE.1
MAMQRSSFAIAQNQRSFNDHDLKLELYLHCRSASGTEYNACQEAALATLDCKSHVQQYVVPVAITTVLTAVRASM